MSGPAAVLVTLALGFALLTGYNGSAVLVATMISTSTLAPRRAFLLAATAVFVGPFLFGLAIANTVAGDIVSPGVLTPPALAAGLVASIIWGIVAGRIGLPTSATHALIGGLIGAGLAQAGLAGINLPGIGRVAAILLVAPLVGGLVGWIFMRLTLSAASGAPPQINRLFRRGQIVTAVLLSLGYGTNTGQQIVGVITLSLKISELRSGAAPSWVIVLAALMLALGVSVGGWSVVHTLGGKIYRIRPIHGFVAQASTAVALLGSAAVGSPVSVNQVMGSAIIAVGAAERVSKVRWDVAQSIVAAWLVTVPACVLMASLLYPLSRLVFTG